jgi:hypothetical protein
VESHCVFVRHWSIEAERSNWKTTAQFRNLPPIRGYLRESMCPCDLRKNAMRSESPPSNQIVGNDKDREATRSQLAMHLFHSGIQIGSEAH